MILETSFIIDLMQGIPGAIEKQKQLNLSGEIQDITTPSIFELWSGIVQCSKPEKEKKKILEVLQSQNILSLDIESAKEAGIIDGTLIKRGIRIDPEDSMIAGIAKTKAEKILTNDSHFSRIQGIELEGY